MCRTQIASFLIEQIITPHSLQQCFSHCSDWFHVRHLRKEKFCEWTKRFDFIAVSLWFGGRSGKTQINPLDSQEKELRVCECFSCSDPVYPLNWSISPNVSEAQSHMQVKEKGHAFSFPPAHPSVLCSIISCVHTNKKDNCFPPNLTWKQPSLNSLVEKGLDRMPVC